MCCEWGRRTLPLCRPRVRLWVRVSGQSPFICWSSCRSLVCVAQLSPTSQCSFLHENSVWSSPGPGSAIRPAQEEPTGLIGGRKAARWAELWDPSQYLPYASLPMLWLNGTNDFAYPLDSYQKSYTSAPGRNDLCIRVEMAHSHADGWAPKEIAEFADAIMCDGELLPQIHAAGCSEDGAEITCEVDTSFAITAVELCYSRATG